MPISTYADFERAAANHEWANRLKSDSEVSAGVTADQETKKRREIRISRRFTNDPGGEDRIRIVQKVPRKMSPRSKAVQKAVQLTA